MLAEFLGLIIVCFTAEINLRVTAINDYFTFSLYGNVCRSLFEKNKLHFAFLLCVRILMDENRIDHEEWHHFLAGGSPQQVHLRPFLVICASFVL